MTSLDSLLSRVRAATSGSDDLDKALYSLDPSRKYVISQYTSSLDAIVGLIERKLPGWVWGIEFYRSGSCAYEAHMESKEIADDLLRYGRSSTAPLALCIAFLEALIAQQKQDGGGK